MLSLSFGSFHELSIVQEFGLAYMFTALCQAFLSFINNVSN